MILAGHLRRHAEVLDQLETRAERQDFNTFDILDVVGELAIVAGVLESVPVRVFRRGRGLENRPAELDDPAVDFGLALGKLLVDVESFARFFLLRQLQTHEEFAWPPIAVEGEPGRIRSTMLERFEHGRHFVANLAARSAMNQSCNATHTRLTLSGIRG